MARNTFGGTSADVAETSTGSRLPNLKGRVFDQEVGGKEITDILTPAGAPMDDGLVSDRRGLIPEFQGPDSVERLWVEFNDGRVMLVANNAGDRLSKVAAVQSDGSLVFPAAGKIHVDAEGNITTPGMVTSRNVGASRIFVAVEDPQKRGVKPIVGDVWVQVRRKDRKQLDERIKQLEEKKKQQQQLEEEKKRQQLDNSDKKQDSQGHVVRVKGNESRDVPSDDPGAYPSDDPLMYPDADGAGVVRDEAGSPVVEDKA